MKTIFKQKLKDYFDMLHGPIYTNLITKFWLNVYVRQSGQTIQSNVYDFPITITQSLNVQTIKCEEKGSYVEYYRFNNVFSIHIRLIYGNYNKLTTSATLIPIAKVWHQLLVSNLRPREKQLKTLTSYDNNLLYFLIHNVKINLPHIVFNFLIEIVVTSREEMISSYLMEEFFLNFSLSYG